MPPDAAAEYEFPEHCPRDRPGVLPVRRGRRAIVAPSGRAFRLAKADRAVSKKLAKGTKLPAAVRKWLST